MKLSDVQNIYIGNKEVSKILLGDVIVWMKENLFINLNPTILWLTEANNFSDIVNVLSNTDWEVK